jgi:hypothetical protein
MEFMSNEILQTVCIETGFEATLQLCKTNLPEKTKDKAWVTSPEFTKLVQ